MTGGFAPLATRRTRHVGRRGVSPGSRGSPTSSANAASIFREHRSSPKTRLRHRARGRALRNGAPGDSDSSRACRVDDVTRHPARSPARERRSQRALIVARLQRRRRAPSMCWPFTARTSATAPIVSTGGSTRSSPTLEPGVPMLIGGDFNCWRPLLRVLFPGWRTLARGRTWPAQRPHSQIDHILGRGPWVSIEASPATAAAITWRSIADVELR